MTSMLCWCMLGLFSETSSDGFHVDNTAPVIQQRVQLFEEEGSFSTNTLVRAALCVRLLQPLFTTVLQSSQL